MCIQTLSILVTDEWTGPGDSFAGRVAVRHGRSTKIAFVGNFKYNLGASNVLLGYIQTGVSLGYDIRPSEFGYIDETIRASVPVAERDWRPDLMVILYESYPFLSPTDIEAICVTIPRDRRVLIDVDGKYCPPISTEGDTNHPVQGSYTEWTDLFNSLSDIILQPALRSSTTVNTKKFLFYGVQPEVYLECPHKDFDFLYVGTNWFRWKTLTGLIKALNSIRNYVRRIAVVGQYWTGDAMPNFASATYSDPDFFSTYTVELYPPAPYGAVEATMSRALINPVLIRPSLNALNLVTPRMFETFMADTVPVMQKDLTDNALTLYGDKVEPLCLSDDPASDILRITKEYPYFRKIVGDIRNRLIDEHSYAIRLKELTSFV